MFGELEDLFDFSAVFLTRLLEVKSGLVLLLNFASEPHYFLFSLCLLDERPFVKQLDPLDHQVWVVVVCRECLSVQQNNFLGGLCLEDFLLPSLENISGRGKQPPEPSLTLIFVTNRQVVNDLVPQTVNDV